MKKTKFLSVAFLSVTLILSGCNKSDSHSNSGEVWQPHITASITQDVPTHTVVGQHYTVGFTFTNDGKTPAIQSSTTVSGVSFVKDENQSNCGNSLSAGAQCKVVGIFSPQQKGTVSDLTAVYSYQGGISEETASTTDVTERGSPQVIVKVKSDNTKPTTEVGTNNTVIFSFTNQGSATATGIYFSPTGSPNVKVTASNCAPTLDAGADCQITVVFTPQAQEVNETIKAGIDYTYQSPSTLVHLDAATTKIVQAQVPMIAGEVTIDTKPPLKVNDTYPVVFKFTNQGNQPATGVIFTLTGSNHFLLDTGKTTCGTNLNSGSSCLVAGNFKPENADVGQTVTLGADYTYSTSLHTTHINASPVPVTGTSHVIGTATDLPASMDVNQSAEVTFTFMNQGEEDAAGISVVGGMGFTLTPGGDGCTGKVLKVKDACTFKGIFVPPMLEDTQATATYTDASETVIANTNTTHVSFQDPEDVKKEVNFLTNSLTFMGNGTFQTIKGVLPRSYYSNKLNYWGDYACQGLSDCSVTDHIYTDPFAIAPVQPVTKGGQLQEERVFTIQGANIYDAATWQIALALASVKQPSQAISSATAEELIKNQNRRLNRVSSKAVACDSVPESGGKCSNGGFYYGYPKNQGNTADATIIQNLKYAYGFRMLGPSYLVDDPFKHTSYDALVKCDASFDDSTLCQKVSWADWKPISGENGWAFLLGPVQSSVLLAKGQPVNPHDIGFDNVLNFLWALQRMQSPIGAFYYATGGSDGNTGAPVPPGEISTENNASILAGLYVLQKSIQDIPNWKIDPKLSAANNVINIMIYGGNLPQGGQTEGLIGDNDPQKMGGYFRHYAWSKDEHIFIQGGFYKNGTFTHSTGDFALDVNTWGTAAIGPKTLDAWFGPGTSYKNWEAAKKRAGYFGTDGKLWGVGYTDQSSSDPKTQKVLSGEWTAGAINMVHMLIVYYEKQPGISQTQLASLREDEKSMISGLLRLRSDLYKGTDFPKDGGIDPTYLTTLDPNQEKAIYYASRRYEIPFGWYANPLPSAASTTWTIMLNYLYNPFGYKGSMESPDFSGTTPIYDKTANQLYSAPNTITVINQLSTNDDFIKPIFVAYTKDGTNWISLTGTNGIDPGSWADITLPASEISQIKTIGVSYQDDFDTTKFYSACSVNFQDTLTQYKLLRGTPLHTALIGSWVKPDGTGPCIILSDYLTNK